MYNKYDRSGVFDTEKHATIRHFDEWKIEKSDKIEAIISEDLYYKCKAILESKKSHINNKGIYRGKGEFAGLIYCKKCGATYNQTAAHGKRLFMCSTKKKYGTTACNNVNISYEKMLEKISSDNYAGKLLFWKMMYTRGIDKLVSRLQEKLTSNNAAEIEECSNELAKLKRERDMLYADWKKKAYEDDEYNALLEPIIPEMIRLREQLAFYAKTNADIENDIAKVEKTMDELRAFEIKEHYTQDEIINDIAKITVYPDGGIDFICKAQHAMEKIRGKHGELFRALNEKQ